MLSKLAKNARRDPEDDKQSGQKSRGEILKSDGLCFFLLTPLEGDKLLKSSTRLLGP
jgi:hypothetical protein